MPNGRGSHRGYRPSPAPGRGRGRGRGRGGYRGSRGMHQDVHLGIHDQLGGDLVFNGNFEDFPLDRMMPQNHNGFESPAFGYRGRQSPRGSGRGRYNKVSKRPVISGGFTGPRIPLSTLYKDRPLLRPVVFVRGEHQKTLFEQVEDILHAPGQEGGVLDDHPPSADIVERIFHREEPVAEGPPSSDIDSTSEGGDEANMEVAAHASPAAEDTAPMFVVDTKPSPVVFAPQPSETIVDNSVTGEGPLGEVVDDDVIVYEAPHPRLKQGTSLPILPSTPSHLAADVRFSPKQASPLLQYSNLMPIGVAPVSSVSHADLDSILSKQVQVRKRIGLKPTPRARKMAKKERAAARRREERNLLNMTSFGLSMQERTALQEGSTIQSDSRYAERRRGDSDVDWGTEDEGAVEEVLTGIGDMDLDGDVGDIATFARFAQSVQGLAGDETIADLEDIARMKEEDEEQVDSDEEGFSQAEEEIFDAEQQKENGENSSVDEEGDSDVKTVLNPGSSWADRDENFLGEIDTLLGKNKHILRVGDRLFKAIGKGEFTDDYEASLPLNLGKKDRVIPPELLDQWTRDRAKKAERKRIRALARMQGAADISLTRKSSKRKQKVLAGARFHGDTLYVDRVSNTIVLEQMIRTFVDDLELSRMVLPPKGIEWRKQAHLVAGAFNLKSKSVGNGEGRFMTLTKSTKSGINVNERKVSRLTNGNNDGRNRSERAGRRVQPRDGDEVGKTAPRLSDSNVGFKLLQQMGWEEGNRLGVTSGLVDPLTAIIKTTKRGLGATR